MRLRPDFSPAMLSFFLRARVSHAHAVDTAHGSHRALQVTAKREKARLRKLAKLTGSEIDFAWMGRLRRAEARARLWAIFGHHPVDHGITLTDDGGQHG